MVAFVSRKRKSKTEIAAPGAPGQRLSLFGPPLLIAGENAAIYDQLLARMRAAAKPVDIIDEIWIDDVVYSEWGVLRWRRLKWSLLQELALEGLVNFLRKFELPPEAFADYLAGILQDNLPEDQADSAQTLAHKCALNEPGAVAKVNNVLADIGLNMDKVQNRADFHEARALAQKYVQREPDAVTRIDKLLADYGGSIETLMRDGLAEKLDYIERIDRLITIAESRRNNSLREIDRRRAVLGEALRRSVQEIEDGQFEVIESTATEGKDAA